jgi:hypothetical protein
MTISFPRDLPAYRFRGGSQFFLERQVTHTPTRGGPVQVAELGSPLWRARYETPPLDGLTGAAWDAWLDSLRAGAKTFKAVHPFLRYARAYPGGYAGMSKHGGGSFTGTANLDAVGETLDTVTLSGLPSTFVLSIGDLLSFVPGGSKQTLHRIVEGGTASSGVATVAVEPVLKPGVTLDVDVSLASPWFKAVIDQQSAQVSWDIAGYCTVAFEAWQTLS